MARAAGGTGTGTVTRRRLAALGGAAGWGVLAACAGTGTGTSESGSAPAPPARQPVTLRFKYRIPSDVVRQSYDRALEVWRSEHPEIVLEPEANDSATFTPSLTAQLVAGTPPDAAPADWNQSLDWASDGLLLPLDDLLKARKISPDEWFPGAMDYTRLGGKACGLPITGYTTVVYYNRDLFQREGVPLPPKDGSWRWRDLEALAVRLTRRDPADPQASRWGLIPSNDVSGGLASAIWQNGATLTDVREAPAKMTIDQPAAVEAISWLADLSQRHRVGPTAEERRALGKDPFVMGKVAMLWGGMALFFNTMFQVTDFTWDLVPGPRGPGGGQGAATQTNAFAIFKGTKHADQAFTLIYFFTAGAGVKVRAEIQQVAVAHKKALQEVWMQARPVVNRQALIDSQPYTRDVYKGRLCSEWITAVQGPINRAIGGEISPKAAADEAAAQGAVVLADARRRS
jgi:multiple sugar transport system substrate-binding protein